MKKWGLYVTIFMVTYMVVLVRTIPAAQVIGRVPDISASGVSGTIWNGHITELQTDSFSLSNLDWSLNTLPLLLGRISSDIRINDPKAKGTATAGSSVAGKMFLSNIDLSVPMSSLEPLFKGRSPMPILLQGDAKLLFDEVVIDNGRPYTIAGTVNLIEPSLTSPMPMKLGNLDIEFTTEGDIIHAEFADQGNGPIKAQGTLQLNRDGNYNLDALLNVKDPNLQSMNNYLQMLGPKDAQGNFQVTYSGQLPAPDALP